MHPHRRREAGGSPYLFGYGFCQKLSPLQLKGGRVSIEQSPLTETWQESRISFSCPTIPMAVQGEVASVKRSSNPFGLRLSMPFLTNTWQLPHKPLPLQLR